jgi:hypothetical protein
MTGKGGTVETTWRYVQQIEEGLEGLKKSLNLKEPPEVRWARQMLSVLDELEKRGGVVLREEFLEIGESFGYQRQGMAGFYQGLVVRDGGATRITNEGKSRLAALRRAGYKKLKPTNPPGS